MFDRMVVSARLKEQLMGNDHNKGLPLLSRTTAPGETYPCLTCRTQGIPGQTTLLS